MLGKQVDGIVMMTDKVTEKIQASMDHSPVPIVLAGSVDESNEIASVNIDYFKAAYEAVKVLIGNGHKKIAFVSGPDTHTVNQYKLDAYKKALEEEGLGVDKSLIVSEEDTYDSGISAYEELSALEEGPTAFLRK